MNDAFREQLLKAGLVTKKAAKAAAHDQNATQRKKRKKGGADAEQRAEAEAAKAAMEEKRARDKALNEQREAEKKARALAAEVDDLISQNTLRDTKGDIAYRFGDGDVIKALMVRAEVQRDLAAGDSGIVRGRAGYALVTRSIAIKIEDRIPDRVILLNDPEPVDDEDDPYRDYKVPDDLMW